MSPLNRRQALKLGTTGMLAAALFGKAVEVEAAPAVSMAEGPIKDRVYAEYVSGFGFFSARRSGDMDSYASLDGKIGITVYADGSANLRVWPILHCGDPAIVTIPLAAPYGQQFVEAVFTDEVAA